MAVCNCKGFIFVACVQIYVTFTGTMKKEERLLKIFQLLLDRFGKRNWWPGETPLEVVIGAILTQNTSWKNVEKAIENLKKHEALDFQTLYRMEKETLAQLIRSSGFYNIKSNRLKNIVNLICEKYLSNLSELKDYDTIIIREILLDIDGIGKETADSIILYALEKPIFVIDAYTKRFLQNHKLFDGKYEYDEMQAFFMSNLPHDTYLFNEYHALIVTLCQNYCRKLPACKGCPLEEDL
jgi:endonuclease III related protein